MCEAAPGQTDSNALILAHRGNRNRKILQQTEPRTRPNTGHSAENEVGASSWNKSVSIRSSLKSVTYFHVSLAAAAAASPLFWGGIFFPEQVQDKLAELARIRQGEPDAGEIAAAKEAQNHRNKKV